MEVTYKSINGQKGLTILVPDLTAKKLNSETGPIVVGPGWWTYIGKGNAGREVYRLDTPDADDDCFDRVCVVVTDYVKPGNNCAIVVGPVDLQGSWNYVTLLSIVPGGSFRTSGYKGRHRQWWIYGETGIREASDAEAAELSAEPERLIVSRHPAAVEFIRSWGPEWADPDIEVCTGNVDIPDLAGKIVAGNIPLRLCSYARQVWAVEFTGEPPRGQEYTAQDMKDAWARLVPYAVQSLEYERWSPDEEVK